jgi:hypothetical protein
MFAHTVEGFERVAEHKSADAGRQRPEGWLLVRASSHSTSASKRSDLPPAGRNRARAAATWLG